MSNYKNVPESKNFTKKYRSIMHEDEVKVYNEKSSISIRYPISFDSYEESFSSVDLFASALISEILLAIQFEATLENTKVLDLEGVISIVLDNPLFILGVRGYKEEPFISKIIIKIYLYSFFDKTNSQILVNAALKKCVLYNSIKSKIPTSFEIEFAV